MHTSIQSSFSKEDTLKVKAIAVILMLFHHLFRLDQYINSFGVNIPFFLEMEQLNRLATDARVCVWIFVFLSAYGIAAKINSKRNQESSIRVLYSQWWALMKPYWFICLIFFLVSFNLPKGAYAVHKGSWLHMLAELLGCAEFFGTGLSVGGWWYISFAQYLILIMPLLLLLVEKTSVFSIPLTYFAIQFVSPGVRSEYGGYYSNYLYAALLGILFVKYDLFGRLGKRPKGLLCVIESIGLLFAFWLLAHLKVSLAQSKFSAITLILMAFSSVALCLFMKKYITASWLEKPLIFLGKHSGNIYLLHLIIYPYFPKFVFCTKTVLGSMVILLGTSLILSVILEKIKKVLRYDQMLNTLSAKLIDWATVKDYHQ